MSTLPQCRSRLIYKDVYVLTSYIALRVHFFLRLSASDRTCQTPGQFEQAMDLEKTKTREQVPLEISTNKYGNESHEPTKQEQGSLDTSTTGDDGLRESSEEMEKSAEYIHGVRLILVIVSISVVYFLNMLDTTVLATVRLPTLVYSEISRIMSRLIIIVGHN